MLHVEFKENEAENTMQANILPLYTPTAPRWGQKVNFFSEVGHLQIKLTVKTCRTLCKFDLRHTPDIFGWIKRSDIEIVQVSIF